MGIIKLHRDQRGRLVREVREDDVNSRDYDLTYEYDQGGNRTEKIDLENNRRVSYSYDISDPGTYESDNNRLAYAETSVNSTSALLHTTWYYYNDAGNARYVVTDEDFGGMMMMSFGGGENPCVDPLECDEGETLYTATRLEYARNNQTLVYAIGEQFCWDGESSATSRRITWAREFRHDGGRQRFLSRELVFSPNNPNTSCYAGSWSAGEATWTDG